MNKADPTTAPHKASKALLVGSFIGITCSSPEAVLVTTATGLFHIRPPGNPGIMSRRDFAIGTIVTVPAIMGFPAFVSTFISLLNIPLLQKFYCQIG
ncbi:MAG: hypothetical protein ACNA8H_09100, partial [Anaerolineales bacterium]